MNPSLPNTPFSNSSINIKINEEYSIEMIAHKARDEAWL
jgi:hypothetical protein